MSRLSDEKIQEMLESQKLISNSDLPLSDIKEIDAYTLVFETLNKKPQEGLSFSFSANVMAEIRKKKSYRINMMWYLFIPVLILAGFFISDRVFAYIELQYSDAFYILLSKYKWILASGFLFFVVIEICDQNLVKLRVNRNRV